MDDRSGMIFHQLLRAHHNACMAALARQGAGDIGSPRLLVTLAQYPSDPGQAPTQRELADRVHSAPATVAASLKVLERQGYVMRRVDQADNRRNRIFITKKGRDALESGMRAFRQVDEYLYHGFSPEERELVYGLHRRMLENLYQIGGDRRHEPRPGPLGEPPPPPPPPEETIERKCTLC